MIGDLIQSAVTQLRSIYTETVFIEQKVDWNTHPNNLGHIKAVVALHRKNSKAGTYTFRSLTGTRKLPRNAAKTKSRAVAKISTK